VRSTTGLVMTVEGGASARALRAAVAARDDLAVHTFRVLRPHSDAAQREPLAGQLARMRERCRASSVRPDDVTRLDTLVAEARPATALAMLQLVDLCVADTGFLLAIVDDTDRARIPPAFTGAVQRVFDREIVDGSPDLVATVRLARPAPARLERSLDQDLLAATVGRGDHARRSWQAWRARASVDDAVGFGAVAPMLSENLHRLRVADAETGRVDGIRRRAWYLNQLLTGLAATAVDALRREGCEPVLLGELPAAVRAAGAGAVRPAHAIDLCVRPDDAVRAADVLVGLGWEPGRPGPITERQLAERTWLRFRMEPRRTLFLHWRAMPQGCSRLVADDARGCVALNGAEVATQSPTAQLLRLWARTGDPRPGHQLRTICDTADIVERCAGEIDWDRLWSDCARLELIEYGEMYLRALPAHLQAATRSPNRFLNSAS
jgi:hypothetical protein